MMKVHEIAETIGISKESVGYTLHEELDMKKHCARWVLRLLTADQKSTCTKYLGVF
jgi:predicted transcriptional regulator